MKQNVISHRGNLSGPIPELENQPAYIQGALTSGYDVEIDVWVVDNQVYLGHDNPEYQVHSEFLCDSRLWCHAKNYDALVYMLRAGVHCFWHQEDDYTITSNNFIWAYPGVPGSTLTITVMPEASPTKYDTTAYAGVCTDYPTKY